jgi:hypothetical protein
MRLSTLIMAAALCAAAPAAHARQHPTPPPPAAAQGDDAQLKTLEAKLAKSPKDAKLKKQVALLHFKVGHAMEYNPRLTPHEKYAGALRHFRRAVALDPTLKAAADAKEEIEQIYRQMGRPIPQ